MQEVSQINHQSVIKVVAISAGAAILAPTVFSLLKPVAKATLKTSIVLSEKTKASLAEAGEVIGDLVAEAKAEMATEEANKSSLATGLSTEQKK